MPRTICTTVALVALSACTDGPGAVDAASDVVVVDATDASHDASATADTMNTYRWERVSTAPSEIAGRWGSIVADRSDGTSILFAGTQREGSGTGITLNDTWLVDNRGTNPLFQLLTTNGAPSERWGGCATYDRLRGVVLMVGGRTATGPTTPATWSFDPRTSAWTQLSLPESPPAVDGCMMAYSTSRHATYLFGGEGTSGFSNRMWRFDPELNSWMLLPAMGPRARSDGVMRALPDGRSFVLFGGTQTVTGQKFYWSDVWRFDTRDESWQEIRPEGSSPRGRRVPWLVVEPDGSGFMLGMGATGIQPTDVLADLWRFDFAASSWQEIPVSSTAPPRGASAAIPGGLGTIALLVGGFDNVDVVRSAWRLRAPESDGRWQ